MAKGEYRVPSPAGSGHPAQGNDILVLEVANEFCEIWLKDNYTGLLQDVVALASGRQMEIEFKVGETSAAAKLVPSPLHSRINRLTAEPQH